MIKMKIDELINVNNEFSKYIEELTSKIKLGNDNKKNMMYINHANKKVFNKYK